MGTKNPSRRTTPTTLPNRPEIRAIKALLAKPRPSLDDYYAVGQRMHDLEADPRVSGSRGWRTEIAEAVGGPRKKSTLNKALQLRRLYATRKSIAELKKIDIRWSFVLIALGVKNPRERHALLRKAKKNLWPAERLQAEIQKRKRSVRGGGRPRRKPEPTAFAPDLHRLLTHLENLHSYVDRVWSEYQAQVRAITKDKVADLGVNSRKLSQVSGEIHDLPVIVKQVVQQVIRLNTKLNPPAKS